jgi:nucleoside diphosphate kinase
MIKPDCYMKIGKIITEIEKEFTIGNLKMYRMNKKNA